MESQSRHLYLVNHCHPILGWLTQGTGYRQGIILTFQHHWQSQKLCLAATNPCGHIDIAGKINRAWAWAATPPSRLNCGSRPYTDTAGGSFPMGEAPLFGRKMLFACVVCLGKDTAPPVLSLLSTHPSAAALA